MKNRYRLISEVKAFISGGYIYIASPDNKGCISKVKSMLPKFNSTEKVLVDELQVELDDLTLRIDENLRPVISSNNLPGGKKREYIVFNYCLNSLGDLILSQDINKGRCSGIFEPAINDDEGMVSLVTPGMDSYKLASDEMIRRMNCQMLKKTKTFIPGHRYDTVDDTIYYLGKIYSHVISDQNSDYIKTSSRQVHLFTRDIGFAKSISEVLNGGVFSVGDIKTDYYKLEQVETLGLMVESGEVLINDYTTFDDYKENILLNSLEVSKIKNYEFSNKTILEVFKFSENPGNKINDVVKIELEDFLKKDIRRILCTFWNNSDSGSSSRLDLSINTPKDELSSRFISKYFYEILEPNIKKHSYYTNLIQDLGIDFRTLVDEMFNNWDPSILEKDFDTFIKYNRGKSYSVRLRTGKSSKFSSYLTIIKLSDVLKDSYLIDCIKDICSFVRSNHGIGCSTYEKINVGTISKPLIYENITISVNDIINYHEERGLEIPENLKYGILDDKFSLININVDLGDIIE